MKQYKCWGVTAVDSKHESRCQTFFVAAADARGAVDLGLRVAEREMHIEGIPYIRTVKSLGTIYLDKGVTG